jgi:hypothetical protein
LFSKVPVIFNTSGERNINTSEKYILTYNHALVPFSFPVCISVQVDVDSVDGWQSIEVELLSPKAHITFLLAGCF